ncbi:hypothetical protein SSCG_02259 [Streptomyces clavuligerus]|nr:hypothetical protein SSCG_02259 [Streptomyces clavuligerus]
MWETRRSLDREGEFGLPHPASLSGHTVARTIAVLRALAALGPGEHPLTAIAESAELPSATAHRYLQAR